MRLGYYTDYSEETAEFAEETGFTSLELSAWPDSAINPDTVSDARLEEIRADLQRRDIEISALGYYPNYLTCRLLKSAPSAAVISSPCSTSRSAWRCSVVSHLRWA